MEEIQEKISEFPLDVGDNFFKVVVTSSDKTKKQDYVLKVVREASSNTDLKNLTVEGYTLTPVYSNTENSYVLEVPYGIEIITINAEKEEAVQNITGLGTKQLNVGTNVFEIVITAENKTQRTIRITVNRKESSDAGIENVAVNGYTLTHLQDNIYYVNIPYNVESIAIENVTTTGAIIEGIEIKENLKIGNNDYEVKVTSSDGKTNNTYIIRIIKEQDKDNTLKGSSKFSGE